VELDEIDLVDLDRFTTGFPHDVFSQLSEQAPVWWHRHLPIRFRAEGG
jgi:hypothetical protein